MNYLFYLKDESGRHIKQYNPVGFVCGYKYIQQLGIDDGEWYDECILIRLDRIMQAQHNCGGNTQQEDAFWDWSTCLIDEMTLSKAEFVLIKREQGGLYAKNNSNKITAIDAARYLLFLAHKKGLGETFSNLKMQKLLYYAQGWYLTMYKKPLFDDVIEAWSHGPVIKSVYDTFKKYDQNSIDFKEIKALDIDKIDQDREARELLIMIYRKYGAIGADELFDIVQKEDPYLDAYCNDNNKEITNELLKRLLEKEINFVAEKLKKELEQEEMQ